MIIKLARDMGPLTAEDWDSRLQEGKENLAKIKRQKSSSFRGAARSASPSQHFEEFIGPLRPKKIFLRTLAKMDKNMPDVKVHPHLNRAMRVIGSTVAKYPKTVIGTGAGLLTTAVLLGSRKKKETV
jgi:hypothetical protein